MIVDVAAATDDDDDADDDDVDVCVKGVAVFEYNKKYSFTACLTLCHFFMCYFSLLSFVRMYVFFS